MVLSVEMDRQRMDVEKRLGLLLHPRGSMEHLVGTPSFTVGSMG